MTVRILPRPGRHSRRALATPYRCPELTEAYRRSWHRMWCGLGDAFQVVKNVLVVLIAVFIITPAVGVVVAAAVYAAGWQWVVGVVAVGGAVALVVWRLVVAQAVRSAVDTPEWPVEAVTDFLPIVDIGCDVDFNQGKENEA